MINSEQLDDGRGYDDRTSAAGVPVDSSGQTDLVEPTNTLDRGEQPSVPPIPPVAAAETTPGPPVGYDRKAHDGHRR